MPIVIPEGGKDVRFYERLEECGSAVIAQESAQRQNFWPARIGLLNLMPAPVMEETELRWLRSISHTVLQIEPVLMKFDDDIRDADGSSRKHILERYQPFSDVAEQGLDGLIVTGDNQERRQDGTLQPFDELNYQANLTRVMDWAEENVAAVVYSCLASHFSLHRRYGLERQLKDKKVFGVYEHEIVNQTSKIVDHTSIVENMDDFIKAPHSRWGDIRTKSLDDVGVEVLAANDEVGWLLAEKATAVGGLTRYVTYLQGHPEYWRNDLQNEYQRDRENVPANYYPDDNPQNEPLLTWANGSRSLLSNWINRIYQGYSL